MAASLMRSLSRSIRLAPFDGPRPLDGFVDSLVQKFENCREGLTDEVVAAGGAEAFFRALYDAERDRLRDAVRSAEPGLAEAAHEELFTTVDRLVSKVVLPGYAERAVHFGRREKNGFYLAREPFHGLERAGFGVAGMLLGAFVVWAPFIPLWSKEWVLPFLVGGLVFPDLRRAFEVRRYERALNRLVAHVDAEIQRIDVSLMLRGDPPPARQAR